MYKTAEPRCQLSTDTGHCLGRGVISPDILDSLSRDMVDSWPHRLRTQFPAGGASALVGGGVPDCGGLLASAVPAWMW